MSSIQPSGVDLTSGQTKILTSNDTLTVPNGNLTIKGGNAITTTSNGSLLTVAGGNAGSTSGDSGGVTIQAGTLVSGSGGNINILGTNGVNGANIGSSIAITAGNSDGTGGGGSIAITSGTGTATDGGNITITGGLGVQNGANIGIQGGVGQNGTAGQVTLAGGNGNIGGSVFMVGGFATSADQSGGQAGMSAGLGRGTGTSNISILGGLSQPSGSTQHTQSLRHAMLSERFNINNGVSSPFCRYDASTIGSMLGMHVKYAITATDGTDFQVEIGNLSITSVNKAGTVSVDFPAAYGVSSTKSGGSTLTVSFSYSVSGANYVVLEATATSSLTTPTIKIACQYFCDTAIAQITVG